MHKVALYDLVGEEFITLEVPSLAPVLVLNGRTFVPSFCSEHIYCEVASLTIPSVVPVASMVEEPHMHCLVEGCDHVVNQTAFCSFHLTLVSPETMQRISDLYSAQNYPAANVLILKLMKHIESLQSRGEWN